MKLNKNIKIFINYFLGPLLFIGLSWFIYKEIKKQPNLADVFSAFQSAKGIVYLLGVLVLMFINWSLEAIKWKLLVHAIQPISFFKSFKAVLSGISFTLIAPNRMGEYLGRVMYMKDGNRLKTISMTVAGSISQLIITLLMGVAGLLVLKNNIQQNNIISSPWLQVIIYGVLAVLIVLTLFYFRLSWLVRLAERLPGSSRFLYLIKALDGLDATILLRLLSLSLLRFVVFIAQYYLLFKLFGVDVTAWQAFWTVSVSFLILAVIPSFAIAELAQRWFVATKTVGIFSANVAGITAAVTGIWIINIALPAIAGSVLILGIKKLLKEKDEEA
jgi:uncharacterized membrane protein YbhN (UPF0104 family)